MKNTNFDLGKVLKWAIPLSILVSIVAISIVAAKACEPDGYDHLAQNQTNISIHNAQISFEEDRFVFKGKIRCEFVKDCSLFIKTGGVKDFNSHTYELLNPELDFIEDWDFDFFFKYNTKPLYIIIKDKFGNVLFEKRNLELDINIFQLRTQLENTKKELEFLQDSQRIEEKIQELKGNTILLESKIEWLEGYLRILEENPNAEIY